MLKLKTNIGADFMAVLLKDAVTEFYRAVDKHPLWPESLVDDTNEEHLRRAKQRIENELCKNMAFNDRDGGKFSTAETVFLEEWFEFLEAAVIKRDLVAARHELAQCMAMLLRIGTYLDDYLPDVKQGGGE
jgi:hypothetical protein